ncbi:MAG TPA: DUF2889 domain-containing protein [Burkholderiaceae bacterium]
MPLSPATANRTPVHSRRIEIQAFRRDDGFWDLDAALVDVKPADFRLASGIREGGTPVHDLTLRVTLNHELDVVDACAIAQAVPYPGACEQITDAYRKLIGLNLLKNFRQRVREILGETRGCSHLSELATALPTAALQAFGAQMREASERERARAGAPERAPFYIGRCHAMAADGQTVRHYYPKWFRGERAEDRASGSPFARGKDIR